MASVCWSLQCLISALTQAGGGGLLFRFACSVVLWGGRGTADKCHWPVWGALAVFRPHWVCPRLQRVLSLSTLLRLQAALQGAGPELQAVTVFGYSTKAQTRLGLRFVPSPPKQPGSQELDERTLPGCSAPYPLCGPHLSFRVHISRVHLVSVLGSWPLAPTLPADVNHPTYRKVFG